MIFIGYNFLNKYFSVDFEYSPELDINNLFTIFKNIRIKLINIIE